MYTNNNNMNILKRMVGESLELLNKHEKVSYTKDDKVNTLFVEVISKNNNVFNFTINNSFPFRPPEHVTINKKSYYNVIKIINPYKKILKEIDGRECLCCSTVLCDNNWFPTRRLWEIVDEGDSIINMKKKLFYLYYCRRISEEKLTYDIPLENYLV